MAQELPNGALTPIVEQSAAELGSEASKAQAADGAAGEHRPANRCINHAVSVVSCVYHLLPF